MKKTLLFFALIISAALHAQAEKAIKTDIVNTIEATTAEMNAFTRMVAGALVSNSDTGTIWRYNGSIWVDLGVVSVDFEDITGNPTDNTALSNALDDLLPLDGSRAMTDDLDMGLNEILNADFIDVNNIELNYGRINNVNYISMFPTDVEPSTGEGRFYWDNSENRLKAFDGTSWKAFLLDGDGGSYLPLSGGTMTGDANWGNNDIVGISYLSSGGAEITTANIGTLSSNNITVNDGVNTIAAPIRYGGMLSTPSALEGQTYFNETTKKLMLYDGTQWVDLGASATGTDDQNASEVPYTDTHSIGETDVQGAIDYALKVTDTEITSTTFNPTSAYKTQIVYLKNLNTITVNEPTGSFSDGDYITYVQDSTGVVEFNFEDVKKGVKYRTTGESAWVFTHYTGNGWTFGCSRCEQYVDDAITASAPLYDFNAESLSLGTLDSWPNDGSGIATSATNAGAANDATVISESGKKAVDFDGSSDYYLIGTPADLDIDISSDDFTVIIVYGSDAGDGGQEEDFGNLETSDFEKDLSIGGTATSNRKVYVGDQSFFDTVIPSVAFSYMVEITGGNITSYINAIEEEESRTTGTDTAVNGWYIGGNPSNTTIVHSSKSIRRVLIWDKVLTATERINIESQLATENKN